MGQEKTQHENGRERRDGRQGRFGRRMGLRVILCGPVLAGHGGKESGPPATADLVGPVLSQPKVLGPHTQLPGSPSLITKLQVRPPLDQGSLYTQLCRVKSTWVSDASCLRPPESKDLEGQRVLGSGDEA